MFLKLLPKFQFHYGSIKRATAKRLFNTLAKGNLGYDEKQKLLKELIAINPDYLSGLTQENIKTKDIGGNLTTTQFNKKFLTNLDELGYE